jgi:hypothetical protein
MVRVRLDMMINLLPHLSKLAHLSLSCAISTEFLASFTMEFDASHRAPNHKIVGPCIHSAQASTLLNLGNIFVFDVKVIYHL